VSGACLWSDGFYKIDFRTALIDPEGTWRIEIKGRDDFNNQANFFGEFELVKPEQEFGLRVEQLSAVESSYSRGEVIDFEFELFNAFGESVSGAEFDLITPFPK